MSYKVVNKTSGLADINLYSGERVSLSPGSSITLKHEVTDRERRFYTKLNCLGIYLVEEKDANEANLTGEITIQNTVIPAAVTPVTETTPETPEGNEETEEPKSEDKDENSYGSKSKEELMKLRQAELIEIAHKTGHPEASTEMSKKDIINLIRGE